jgi:hypothetical protein
MLVVRIAKPKKEKTQEERAEASLLQVPIISHKGDHRAWRLDEVT